MTKEFFIFDVGSINFRILTDYELAEIKEIKDKFISNHERKN